MTLRDGERESPNNGDAEPLSWDEDYRDSVAGILTAERTSGEVSFVLAHTGLRPPARVVDLGCGHGRHAIELARRGFDVTGVDQNRSSLELARQALEAGMRAKFVEADYGSPLDGPFDLIISLFGSFGFGSDEDNARVLSVWCEHLAPGGSLVLDVWHRDMIVTRFEPRRTWNASPTLVIAERRDFDPLSGRLRVHYEYSRGDGSRQKRELEVRLYTAAELRTMLNLGGVEVTGLFGSLRGDAYSLSAPSLVIAGRKHGSRAPSPD